MATTKRVQTPEEQQQAVEAAMLKLNAGRSFEAFPDAKQPVAKKRKTEEDEDEAEE